MRYRIEANLLGRGFENDRAETVYTDDEDVATMMFRFFLDNGIRPVRLIDQDECDVVVMKAENGMRTGC